jgi:very-short-patch-repair endonuclease
MQSTRKPFCYDKNMETSTYVIIGLIVLALILIKVIITAASKTKKVFKNNVYYYSAKPSLMTKTESEFFIKLEHVVGERYFVFPQVHLSALLDHRVKGQEWAYAFRHINGKSVDYVLCDRETLRPTYAIELDDDTHDQIDRKKRDAEVERIFDGANLPLIRFRNKDVSSENIIQALTNANK